MSRVSRSLSAALALSDQLTEWPSILPGVDVPLEPGMMLSIEPSATTAHCWLLLPLQRYAPTLEPGAALLPP